MIIQYHYSFLNNSAYLSYILFILFIFPHSPLPTKGWKPPHTLRTTCYRGAMESFVSYKKHPRSYTCMKGT